MILDLHLKVVNLDEHNIANKFASIMAISFSIFSFNQ